MITKIKINNCLAFNKEEEFNLKADMRTKKFVSNIIHLEKNDILKTAVIYGPNNTGKTTLVKCIASIKDTLLNQKTLMISNMFNESKICDLGISFIYNNKEYNYEYKYDDEKAEYIYEKMSEIIKDRYNNEKEELIYLRDNQNNKYYFPKNADLEQALSITSNSNIVIYTLQIEKFEELKQIKNILTTIANNIEIIDMNKLTIIDKLIDTKTIDILKENNIESKKIVNFIKNADLYLDNIVYLDNLETVMQGEEAYEKLKSNPFLLEQAKLASIYKGKTVPSLLYDSLGTRKITALASYVIEAIEKGKTLVIDELDSSLHFKITRAIIGMFNNEANKNAQLIATLHDISLLDCKKMFRKEQIWFTDKDEDGTDLYSLKEFSYEKEGIRDTTDISDKYSKGVFGAVPEPDLISSLLEDNENM